MLEFNQSKLLKQYVEFNRKKYRSRKNIEKDGKVLIDVKIVSNEKG